MKIINRSVVFILAASVGMTCLASCGKKPDTETEKDETTSVTTTERAPLVFGFEDVSDSSSDYKINSEENASQFFSCSRKNIFGLEKVAIIDKSLVVIFDKETSDKCMCYAKELITSDDTLGISLNNMSALYPSHDLTEKDGKYIITAKLDYTDSDLVDPNRELKVTQISFWNNRRAMAIHILGEDLKLVYAPGNGDTHEQFYDTSEKKWDSVKSEFYEPEPEDPAKEYSEYARYLAVRRPSSSDAGPYVFEKDGVRYELTGDGGNYLFVYISNESEEVKTVGGSRYIQKIEGDSVIDLGMSSRDSTYSSTKIKDMPPVTVRDVTGHENNLSSDYQELPVTELKENETFEIEPGHLYEVMVLSEDFDIYETGIYRLHYGEAAIDYEIWWEEVW